MPTTADRSTMRLARSLAVLFTFAGLLCAPLLGQTPGKQPLHERIDALVEAAAVGPLAPHCTDADFVRRIYLDLTGVIPTADQAREFLADKAPDKRERLIDALFASPAFLRHMTVTLDVMLMERKPEKVIKQPEWEAYLYKSLAADKPVDQLFHELIAADGADAALRAAARFVLDRDAEPNLVTRDVGRLVFGMDLQCCQCHDHPLIDDYYQDDYYGLFAFVHRTSLFTDAKTKQVSLTEKADGEASFKSVFTGASSDKALPRLPKGAVLFVEPTFAKGQEYTVKPDKTVRGVPKFSRRASLAEMIPTSREFSRNLANRLWAHMLGRGIVHPVDFHYAGNPPANPRLLTLLADELAAGGFKLTPLLRELALTRTYQRSCDAPRPETVNFADIAARLDRLAAEKRSLQQSIQPLKDALAVAKSEFKTARDDDVRLAAELKKLEAAVDAAGQSLQTTTMQQKAAETALAKTREQAQAVAEAAAKANSAAATLSNEKTLAEASEKIARLAAELTSASQAAERTVRERVAENKSAAKKVSEAVDAAAAATAARPAAARLREQEQAQLSAEHRLSEASFSVAAVDAQIATCKSILDYAALAKTDPVKAEAAWTTIVERWTIAGQVAPLKPLTPEQLAASTMQATGVFAAQIAVVDAKLTKSPPEPLKNAAQTDKPPLASMYQQLELLNQLRGPLGDFVRQYGGLPGQEFQATVGQALFLSNGDTIDGWLKPKGDNLVARLVARRGQADLTDPEQTSDLVDELYFSALSRPASDAEQAEVARYLKTAADKPAAFGELVWALLSSTEFRFNH